MIKVQNLFYAYLGHSPWVLNNITFDLVEGQFVAIIGANGSGKSTLLHCFNGLIQPAEGHIQIDDLSVLAPQDIPVIRQKVGLVFQNPDDQIIASTVEREIAFGLENLGIPYEEMHRRVNEVMDQFHLRTYRKKDPNQLSGGERQRLALASILVMSPKYLLLDEPTSLLDPGARQDFLSALQKLHRQKTTTPVLVTQIPSEAAMADRIIVLDQGQIALDGPPSKIYGQTDTLTHLGLHPPLAAQISRSLGLSIPFPLTIETLVHRIQMPADPPQTRAQRSEPIPTASPIVSARSLCHTYDRKLPSELTALDHLDLDIYDGEIAVLIGPGGSGKSTFVQHLNGLLTPTSGTLRVCGLNPQTKKTLRDLRRRVGLIFQFPEAQLFAETVYDDIAFGPENLQLPDVSARVHEALEQVGLDPERFLDRDPLRLSGGEKRRVAIAGILATKPEMLLFDEPTAGLDPVGSHLIESLIQTQKKEGRTVVVITHDLDLAARLADRIYLFQDGKVILHGLPAEILTSETLLPLGLYPPEIVQLAEALHKKNSAFPQTFASAATLSAFLSGNSS
jgi:energy-coupling factor transport system ATP-binding protein